MVVSLRSALNSWTTPRVASSVTSRVQVCDLCFAIEFLFLSSFSGYGIRLSSSARYGNFRIYGTGIGERTIKKDGVVDMGMELMHEDEKRKSNENPTKQTNRAIIRQISKPTILAEELKHCHNESTK